MTAEPPVPDESKPDASPPDASPPAPRPDAPRLADRSRFLNREAAEVYLLLDFLSGRSDRSIAATPDELGRALLNEQAIRGAAADGSTDAEIADRTRVEADLRDPTRMVLRVMTIKYPMIPGSSRFEPDAAFLLRARDVLNFRASPTTGASIAFTWLVFRERLRLGRRAGRSPRTAVVPLPDADPGDAAAAFAEDAFPDFLGAANDLARQIRRVVMLMLPLLLLVMALSAYAAWGKVLLDTIDVARKDFGAIEQSIESLEATGFRPASGQGPAQSESVHLCDRPKLLVPVPASAGLAVTAYDSTAEYHLCDRLEDVNRRMSQAYAHLDAWAGPARLWQVRATDEQWATAALTVLSNSVMPVLYGLLGSMAYVLRRFHDRLAASLLTSRDQRANLIRLALGALIGASIGLFGNSSAVTPQTTGVLGLAVNLSGSAIAFLAGYGVEAVFRTLDGLISSVFRIGEAETGGRR